MATKRGDDVELTWQPATDPDTTTYNVWKVIDSDKTRIPRANLLHADANPAPFLDGICRDVPLGSETCTDSGAEGFEGTTHP